MKDRTIIIFLLLLLVLILMGAAIADMRIELQQLKKKQQTVIRTAETLQAELDETRMDLDDRVTLLDSHVQFFITGGWK